MLAFFFRIMTKDDFILLQNWFESPNFGAGVELYKRLGTSNILKRMLDEKPTEYLMNRLKDEMKHLIASYSPIAEKQEEVRAVRIIESKAALPSELENAPQIIKEAVAKRRNLYNEYLRLHGLLKPFVEEEERRKASLRILDIFDEIAPIWDLTNYYDVNLKLPENKSSEVDFESLNDVELNQLYERAYKYVRKYQSVERKKTDCIERIETAEQIKKILVKRATFYHQRLVFPNFDES